MFVRLAVRNGRFVVNFVNKKYVHQFSDRFDKYVPEKFKPLWTHPTGPKTIFFWAPVSKMGLVLAALKDLTRDPENVSIPQTLSLLINGLLCARYAMVIEPINYIYFSANFLLFLSEVIQLFRAFGTTKKN